MDSAIPDADLPHRHRLVRRIGWVIVLLALAAISVHFLLAVLGKYQHVDPAAYTMFWTRRGWLWTHLAGGALTIALGPLQLLTRWPRAWPRLHRWSGRAYIAGMLVACVGATGLIATSPAPFAIRLAFAATALAWLSTAFVGLAAVYRDRVLAHRRWMIRNYLVTLSPITFRMLLPAAIAMGVAPSPGVIATLLWLSWMLPVLVCEMVLRIIGLRRVRPAPAVEWMP